MIRLFLLLLLTAAPLWAASGNWIMSTNLQIVTTAATIRPYTGTDSSTPAYMCWLYASTDPSYQGSNTLTVQAVSPITFQANVTYYVFARCYDYQDHKMAVTIGNATVANTQAMSSSDFNRRYNGPFVLTPSANSTNLSLTFYRTNYPATDNTVKYLLQGLYITTNQFEDIAYEGQDQIQIFRPPAAKVTNIVAGNRILNSSFELGPNAHGWGGLSHTSDGRSFFTSEMWDTSTAQQGKYSLKFPAKSTWYSTIFPLERPNQTFTLSFYGKVDTSYTNAAYGSDGHKILVSIANALTAPDSQQAVTNYAIQFNLTTSWARYTTNITLWGYPTNFYQLNFASHYQLASTLDSYPSQWIDAVQLEEGTTANTYTQKNAVEIGIGVAPMAKTFHVGETREFSVYSYNRGASSVTNTFYYEVRDLANALMLSGSPSLVFPAGNGTNTISLSGVTKYGVFRILGRVDSDEDETSYSYLATDGTTNRTGVADWIGTHANGNAAMAQAHRERFGLSLNRGLSPLSVLRWASTEEVQNTYTWPTNRIVATSTNGMELMVVFSTNFEWPSWANDTVSGQTVPNLTYWSNWVYQATLFCKTYANIYEFWNEPQYVTSINASSYGHRINMMKMFIGAVKAADSTGKILIIGGDSDATRSLAVWNGLSASEKTNVYGLDVHIYPDQTGIDTMGPNTESRIDSFATAFGSLTNFWNTESGAQDTGGFLKGKNSTFKLLGDYYNAYGRSKRYFQIFNNVDQTAFVALRSLGRGMKFIYYDSRNTSSHPGLLDTTHTGYEHFDAMHPKLYTMAFLNQTLKGFSSGNTKRTNSSNAYIEAYSFSNGGTNILAILNGDFTNRYLTLGQTNFIQWDAEGNAVTRANLARVYVTRRPTYLWSSALTESQLVTAFTGATLTNVADTTAPNLSLDVTPLSVVNTNQATFRFRWFAQDDTYLPNDTTPNNLVYRYRLVGYNDWQSWSQDTTAAFTDLSQGVNYHFEAEARDADGNVGTATGPTFSLTDGVVVTPPSSTERGFGRLGRFK